ncbi:MAG: DUF4147 domain-containing protein [Acidaminococcus intestini]|uniref:DUF4147 domain-containing protein n=1 Tax=Acidaminococcus intestini TaxID=187327 RepID=A0A943EF46_9FIRM|nr:DUF4147 domain-containing protein [Acidaminococcus intestini]
MTLREDAQIIMDKALAASLPDAAVEKALKDKRFGSGRIIVVSIGKAAWQMAKTTVALLGNRISGGIVITKYQHAKGALPPLEIYEAGHPVLDANSVAATARAIDMVKDLGKDDTVLFLISGGGSALFEKPLIPLSELQKINSDLLSSGADIVSMNTVRKRFSAVKGGKFAQICAPAKVYAIVLSDIIGDPLDMIASGPAYPDTSTREEAQKVIERYKVILSPEAEACLTVETPKRLDNVETVVTGSVTELAKAGKKAAEALGYRTYILTSSLDCEAREAGSFLAAVGPAARGIAGLSNVAVFSFGSDGTDGPTDAAGGYADGSTAARLLKVGLSISDVLERNDAYHALEKSDGLLVTGPTGTNVNDLSVLLID